MITDNFKDWFRKALIRAIWTVAETSLALIGTSTMLEEVSWKMVISSSILAGIISLLKSVVTGLPEVDESEVQTNGTGNSN